VVSPDQKVELIAAAREARANAYARYSRYRVGAAILTRIGKMFPGCNVENTSYGLTICAERSAVFNAVAAGDVDFVQLVVVTGDGGTPCGACRQVLSEFCDDLSILVVSEDEGGAEREYRLPQLLPERFDLRDQ